MVTIRQKLTEHGFKALKTYEAESSWAQSCKECWDPHEKVSDALDLKLDRDYDMECELLNRSLSFSVMLKFVQALGRLESTNMQVVADADLKLQKSRVGFSTSSLLSHESGEAPRRVLDQLIEKRLKEIVGKPQNPGGQVLLRTTGWAMTSEMRLSKALWGFGTENLLIITEETLKEGVWSIEESGPDGFRGERWPGQTVWQLEQTDTVEILETAEVFLQNMTTADALKAARNI